MIKDYSKLSGYDIIGDIHGHYTVLEKLLIKLGYSKHGDTWQHSERIAIFVGDLIDRGSEQIKVVNTVRTMVENEKALCIMGNHEFNAISYFTKKNDGEPLRKLSTVHEDPHLSFLNEVIDNSPLHAEYISWFKTLPLWIELDDLCVIHACRDEETMDFLRNNGLTANNCLTDELIYKANQKGSKEYKAIELLCKGLEIPLPKGCYFHDKDGKKRNNIRTRWWDNNAKTYREIALLSEDKLKDIPDTLLLQEIPIKKPSLPTCIGHYWLNPNTVPVPMAENVACVDYSAGDGGPLTAYRWYRSDNGKFLSKRFVSVKQ